MACDKLNAFCCNSLDMELPHISERTRRQQKKKMIPVVDWFYGVIEDIKC